MSSRVPSMVATRSGRFTRRAMCPVVAENNGERGIAIVHLLNMAGKAVVISAPVLKLNLVILTCVQCMGTTRRGVLSRPAVKAARMEQNGAQGFARNRSPDLAAETAAIWDRVSSVYDATHTGVQCMVITQSGHHSVSVPQHAITVQWLEPGHAPTLHQNTQAGTVLS